MGASTPDLERTIMDCWHRELERAGTESEVVRSASDFLALWSPQELAPLTLGWRDVQVESAEDLERLKKWLLEDLGVSTWPKGAALRELGDYFWHAATRIEEIRARDQCLANAPITMAASMTIHPMHAR
jgi:hypothetical protein